MRAILSVALVAIAVGVGSCARQQVAAGPNGNTAISTNAGAAPAAPAPPAAPAAPSAPGAPGAEGARPPMTPEDSARMAVMMAARRDSIAKDRDKLYNEALAKIAGRENQPAESVYKNIKLFKGAPASRVLGIMARGFDPALGVSCSHCHVVGEYDKEDKPTKQIAREMFAMVTTINTEILPKIKNIRSPNPTVNCSTCHRGQTRPGAGSAAGPPRPPGQD